ncbi:MAG: glycosyltransferase, partial [Patescibacteria group bacterium]
MKVPKLSIIILNYNTRELLWQCLKSIAYSCQIIVVDNNSSDGSVTMVEKEFPKVEIIKRNINDGYTRGNNAARKLAKGEYVLFLNSDTKAFPGTISTMVEFMDSNLKIGISTCLTELPNGKLYYACHRGFPTPLNSLLYFLGLPSSYYPKYQNIIHEI